GVIQRRFRFRIPRQETLGPSSILSKLRPELWRFGNLGKIQRLSRPARIDGQKHFGLQQTETPGRFQSQPRLRRGECLMELPGLKEFFPLQVQGVRRTPRATRAEGHADHGNQAHYGLGGGGLPLPSAPPASYPPSIEQPSTTRRISRRCMLLLTK